MPRIVFMGSPAFAVPSLEELCAAYEVAGVVTQPDRPSGRGNEIQPPPVREFANHKGLACIQPQRLREAWVYDQLLAWKPDLIVVAAYGQILKQNILDLPPYGCINVHASLLPRWRGAAPIPAAILNGDQATGITIMQMDAGLDTGPILAQKSERIQPDDTTLTLTTRLSMLGADLVVESLPGIFNGTLQPRAQEEAGSSYAPIIHKEDGRLDFTRSAGMLERQIRAYTPWPGSFTVIGEQRLAILKAHSAKVETFQEFLSGMTTRFGKLPAIVCQDGLLVLDEVQLAGKSPLAGKAFLNGFRNWGTIQIQNRE